MSQPKMGKKMKLPSLFKNRGDLKNNHHLWQWPSSACTLPRTLSFRSGGGETMFKMMNSVFFDHHHAPEFESQESRSVDFSELPSFSAALEGPVKEEEESMEVIIRGAQSERLFFEPRDSCLILERKDEKGCSERWASWSPSLGRRVMLAMESEDPYEDFRKSMEEMVESHGLRDWECLKELLGWYLRVNGESNHGFIVGAFVDLLVTLAAAASSSSSSFSSSSTATFSSSSSCTYSSASVAFNSVSSSAAATYHDPSFSSSFCSVSTFFDSVGSSFSSVSASCSFNGLAERGGKMVMP